MPNYHATAEGNVPFTEQEEIEWAAAQAAYENAPPPVPASIPMLNAHLTLIAHGWMADVMAYLASLPGVEGDQARIYFDKAQTMRRDHPLVKGIPAAIGKTEDEVDALFIAAEALDV